MTTEQTRLDRELQDLYDSDEYDEKKAEELESKSDELQRGLRVHEEARSTWTAEILAAAGAIVTLDGLGKVLIHRGLVKREDRETAAQATAAARGEPEPQEAVRAAHSEALVRRLTAHRTVALQRLLAENTQVALAALTHNYVQRLWGETYWPDSALAVKLDSCESALISAGEDELQAGRAWAELKALRDSWGDRLPGDPQKLLPWLIALPSSELCELLALCAALSLNAVSAADREHPADALAAALGLDMADWWAATGTSYLQHVSKAQILAVVTEVSSEAEAAPLAKLKKGELAARAEAVLVGKRWLPSPLRARV
jgi:ParB family chromosome partitioning protein